MRSVTQWIWRDALSMDDWLPPEPTRGERYGGDDICWLCAGATHGKGWPLAKGIKPTFTDFAEAQAGHSLTVCGSCVALSSSDAYALYATSVGRETTFPLKPGKTYARPLNWLYFSHVITPREHLTPDRKTWRELLTDPPDPPFVMAMAINGKKHVLFRCSISHSRDHFTVQADETRIQVERTKFAQCLDQFEEAYSLGLSKDSLLTGQYNQSAILKVGVVIWHEVEKRMKAWRTMHPGWMTICHFCGQKKD